MQITIFNNRREIVKTIRNKNKNKIIVSLFQSIVYTSSLNIHSYRENDYSKLKENVWTSFSFH